MESLIQRLEKIFLGQFGCRLSFLAESDLVTSEWEQEGLRDLRQGHSLFVRDLSGNRMGFAVHTEGTFAGLAIVSDLNNLSDKNETKESDRLLDLAGFAVAMMEEEVATDKKEKPLILKRAEENLILQDAKKNVVQLRQPRLMDDPWSVLPTPKATVVSTLVTAKPGFPFQRLAIDVHVRSGRVACLSLRDLPADSLSSLETIRALGSITVFIEDVTTLTLEQQARLAEFLRTQPSEDEPVVLACTTSSIEDLIIDGRLDRELALGLMQVRIPWNPQDNDAAAVKKACRILIDGADSVAPEKHFVPFHAKFLDEDHPTFH